MNIPAKFALPVPLQESAPQPAFDRLLQAGSTTLFSAPPGFLLTSQLAGKLADFCPTILWIRLSREDEDPGLLLASLAAVVQRAFPGAGAQTMVRMRQHPGPREGWQALFTGLARDLDHASGGIASGGWSAGLPGVDFALVIEHIDELGSSTRGRSQSSALLWETFLPLLYPTAIRVLTRHESYPRGAPPGYILQRGPADLRLDDASVIAMTERAGVRLPAASLRRFVALVEGRGEVLSGLFTAAHEQGSETLRRAVHSASSHADLLVRVARGTLETLDPQANELLALALRTEYLHPALVQAVFGEAVEIPGDWLQPLSGSWARLRRAWREPLSALLRPASLIQRGSLERAAGFLLGQGTYEQAIPLLLELGQPEEAARALIQVAENLLDYGQWETLSRWLGQIPQEVRRGWPWLVYTEGELAAARGENRAARRVFAVSSRMFHERGDWRGACQSLLTESCLAAWQNEPARAWEFAEHARALAAQAGLLWHEGWATWQLGALAFVTGQPEEALRNFSQSAAAAAALEDVQMAAFVGQARHLTQTQVDAEQDMRAHRQAYASAEQVRAEAAGRLRVLLANPARPAGHLLSRYGWSRTPLFLKLSPASQEQPAQERLRNVLRGLLGMEPQPSYPPGPDHDPYFDMPEQPFAPENRFTPFFPALNGGSGFPGGADSDLPLDANTDLESFPRPLPFPVTGKPGAASIQDPAPAVPPAEEPHLPPSPLAGPAFTVLPQSDADGQPISFSDSLLPAPLPQGRAAAAQALPQSIYPVADPGRPPADGKQDRAAQGNNAPVDGETATPPTGPLPETGEKPVPFLQPPGINARVYPILEPEASSRQPAAAKQPAAAEQPEELPLTAPSPLTVPPSLKTPAPQPAGSESVQVFLLGDFRIIADNQSVETWPGGRGKAVFAYLLTQCSRSVPRDVLMDTFWPDVSPEAARNSLNVAIYSLRQSLKTLINRPVILFHENAYRIDPELALWLDFSVFEQRVTEGRQFESGGQQAAAIPCYQTALNLYRGDLLVDFPYEDWAVLERERLRVLYLETLDRLSLIYFQQGQYTESANLCQRMLTSDACREDAHCRLMRCYSRQGQSSLALRQYQACVEALRAELDVLPSQSTTLLFEQIRRREPV